MQIDAVTIHHDEPISRIVRDISFRHALVVDLREDIGECGIEAAERPSRFFMERGRTDEILLVLY
ncbi:hypothetical protein [Bradyrhizobium sp. 169]|uniref:hypothetical protein n=1 Tax=Bradyrhizobium sp. 169 TaxID=2782640 RepID=UPI001FFAC179|nr:hypothetical protein [Bradyrhizobium sp. 169]MCK1589318.1 hypothetical protein [Bradyrhizobium sp. 169]